MRICRSGHDRTSGRASAIWSLAALAILSAMGAHLTIHISLAAIDAAEIGLLGWPLHHLRLAEGPGQTLRGNDYAAAKIHFVKLHETKDARLAAPPRATRLTSILAPPVTVRQAEGLTLSAQKGRSPPISL